MEIEKSMEQAWDISCIPQCTYVFNLGTPKYGITYLVNA
uniref:Uncharacterized protein n=1 Tax=Rhizophora mucronata TaxID=61149 RepID=A0A2P2IM22_RHIMU